MKRLLLLCLPLLVVLLPAPIEGQTTNRAGIVVMFSDGRVQTSCVAFQTESINGLELLQRTGLDVIAQSTGGGAAVCKIGGDGCAFPAEPCFCKFGGGQQGQYWAYWRLNNGVWRYAAQGASSVRVANGDVEGWAWGSGNVQSGAAPPATSFEQICPAAPVQATTPPTPAPTAKPSATPAPTAKPSATPAPTAKPTSKPAPTAKPSATPAPTAKPSATPAPTAKPTSKPIVAQAPSSPTQRPAATPTVEPPTTTSVPTATATIAATASPTSTTSTTPTNTATTTASMPTTTATDVAPQSSNLGSYLIFGVMLAGLAATIGVAQWKRRR